MGISLGRRSAFDYYDKFLSLNIDQQARELFNKSPDFWKNIGEEKAIETFERASNSVPAYKDFLNGHNVSAESILKTDNFTSIPTVSKSNYLNLYPLGELCWGGDLKNQHVISVSSGSTGEPFFWPRDYLQEKEVDVYYELLLKHGFEVDKHTTLLIVGYSMGMYVAGPFTFSSCLRIANKGYPLTIATPGIELKDIIKVISHLAPQFDQLVIAGYPPFVKDVLDAGDQANIHWKQMRIRFVFGAEAFSEKWRDHMLERVRSDDKLQNSSNTYGSADSAILGMETPLSIFVRREAEKNKDFRALLFGDERVPALFQYNPLFKHFEALDDRSLVFTASTGLPLIRYKIGDTGGVISYRQMMENLTLAKIEVPETLIKSSYKIPFVYLYDRSDFTAHLYGVNIYIENIKSSLDTAVMANHFTGKFTMTTVTKSNFDQALMIYLEMSPDTKPSPMLRRLAEKNICEALKARNSEYGRLFQAVGRKAMPKVRLVRHQDKKYFNTGTKQRWKS